MKYVLSLVLAAAGTLAHADHEVVSSYVTEVEGGKYYLMAPGKLRQANSENTMTYDPDAGMGGDFTLNYDVGTDNSRMVGYVCSGKGGYRKGGQWITGADQGTGLPVMLNDLDDNVKLTWQTFQEEARDADDKWMASFNAILSTSKIDKEPVEEDRDFDVVIMAQSHNFHDETEDRMKPRRGDGAFWYFARNEDKSLIYYTITLNDIEYNYAIRYKFFDTNGDDQNKVHVKFIPVGDVAPYLDHPIKGFIDAARSHYLDVYPDQFDKEYRKTLKSKIRLAKKKMFDDKLSLKAMRAGYELYQGKGVLGNTFFK